MSILLCLFGLAFGKASIAETPSKAPRPAIDPFALRLAQNERQRALEGSGQASTTPRPAAYPVKPVRVLTAFPTGSGPDSALRLVGERLASAWGQQLVVDNRPGGNGFIAAEAARRAAADGYTFVQLDSSHLAVHPHLYRKMPYDPARDFDPAATLFRTYFFIVVPTTSTWKNVSDLIAEARSQPGKLSYGSWFIGSPGHLGTAQLELDTGTRMHHVIYKDLGQLYFAVGNNEVGWAFGTAGSSAAAYQAKKVRYLAAAAPQRFASYPDVPTVAEAGGPPGFEVRAWMAIMAPHGTAATAIGLLNDEIRKALAEQHVRDRFEAFGYEPMALAPVELKRLIEVDSKRAGAVVKRLNIALD
jgi:tripartite-type tricarboxylate transporter receptor subunit TctC